jgi:hypothetical protein
MDGSFASLLKNSAATNGKSAQLGDGQRKAPRLVLTKTTPTVAA